MWQWIKDHWWPYGGVGTRIIVTEFNKDKVNKIKNFFRKLFKRGDK